MSTSIKVDFRNPEPAYEAIYRERTAKLRWIMANLDKLEALKAYYSGTPKGIVDFIEDWGTTADPRNLDVNRPVLMPFIPFPKQRDWLLWVLDRWRAREPGLTEKSRDCGASWMSVALGCTLCLFNRGMVIGYGSRKEEYVDDTNNPKALFYKARVFMAELPLIFRGGWVRNQHAAHMRIVFPNTGSAMTGEVGDNIGRGDRTTMTFVDEAAFLEHPQLVDMALSQTTNCRQDISTPNGRGNSFEQKRHSGKIKVFTFHWRDDPRKDEAWYLKQKNDLDAVTVAQEIDINYSASVAGIVIPHEWVMAAIDADKKLNLKTSGARRAALDVADEGTDLNAMCAAHGFRVEHMEEWTGKESDIFETVYRAFSVCDRLGYPGFDYDADGLGAGVRGDARAINQQRSIGGVRTIQVIPFRGSAGVVGPEDEDEPGRKNIDFFANRKAQAWWRVRKLFRNTYRWVRQNEPPANRDEIIVLPSDLPCLTKLCSELSQPTWSKGATGKILIDKQPDGARSPNLADCLMIRFSGGTPDPTDIPSDVMQRARAIATIAQRLGKPARSRARHRH
jgi:phage terminase large subunit